MSWVKPRHERLKGAVGRAVPAAVAAAAAATAAGASAPTAVAAAAGAATINGATLIVVVVIVVVAVVVGRASGAALTRAHARASDRRELELHGVPARHMDVLVRGLALAVMAERSH